MVLKEQFYLFKQNEVYQELDNLLREKIGSLSAEIVNRDTPSGLRDQYVRGAIHALISVLEWEPEFPKEEEVEDDDEI